MLEVALAEETRVKCRGGVLHREIAGETVLLNVEGGQYFALNEVGTAIWKRLEGGAALGEVKAALLEQFEASPETIWNDLVMLVREMLASELVEIDQ
jgi:hypothetical protein